MIFEEVTGQNGKTNLQIQYARVNWKATHDKRKVLRASIVGSRQIIEFDEVGGPHNRLWFAGQSWSNHSWERLLLPPQAVADFPFYPVLICCRRGESKLPPKQLLQERLTRLYQASYARIERHAKFRDKVFARQRKEGQGGAVGNNSGGSLARPSTLLQPAPRPSTFADIRSRQPMDDGAMQSEPYISHIRHEVPNAEENCRGQDPDFVDISAGRVLDKSTSRNALCHSPGSPRPTKEAARIWRLSKGETLRSKSWGVNGAEPGAPGAPEDGDQEQNADGEADADNTTDADREDATDAGEDFEEVEDDAVYEEDDDHENENEHERESQHPHGSVGEAAEDDVEESESGNLVEDSENPDDESNMDLDEDAQSGDAADDSLLGDELDASELDEQEDDQEAEEDDDDGEGDLEDAEDELGLDEAFDEMEDEMADFDDDGMHEFSDGGEMDGGMGYMGDGDGGDFGMGDLDGDTGGDMAF